MGKERIEQTRSGKENTMFKSISTGNRGRRPLDDMVGVRDRLIMRLLNCDILLEGICGAALLLLEGF